jgi:hypothetical protein
MRVLSHAVMYRLATEGELYIAPPPPFPPKYATQREISFNTLSFVEDKWLVGDDM